MSINILNVLDNAHKASEKISEEIKSRLDDLVYNIYSTKTAQRIKDELDLLKEKKEIATKEIQLLNEFIKTALKYKEDPSTAFINNSPNFDYFNKNVERHLFEYGFKNAICSFCSKKQTKRTGVVQTIDPIHECLCYICTDCFINHSRKKETANEKNT